MSEQRLIDGKYQTVRLLGQGGMGAVYEAVHRGTGRRVALKVILAEALSLSGGASAESLARFQREALASGAIDSQHVVQVLDTGVDAATKSPYMVMEYLSGGDALDAVQKHGPLLPHLVLRITAQACLGLHHAHEAGIVHRDIKSANVYLARRNEGEMVVKILDFGIAKVRADPLAGGDHSLTRTGSMLGSPLYMSPEQAKGAKSLDGRADIWSLGCMMYELLTGVTPNHDVQTLGELILAICSEPAKPVQDLAPWVPPEVAAIVHRALARNLNERYQTAAEMRAACLALLPRGETTIQEGMLGPVPQAMKSVKAPRWGTTGPEVPRTSQTMPSSPSLSNSASNSAVAHASSSANQLVPTGTTGAVATSVTGNTPPPTPAVTKVLIPAFIGLAIGGIGLIGAIKWRDHKQAEAIVPQPSASVSTAPVATDRVVEVSIKPADAVVEIDGAETPVHDGKVEIKGALGSVHHVRVTSDGHESKADVVVSAGGAAPSTIEVVVPPAPSASASASSSAPPRVAPRTPSPGPAPAPAPSPVPAVKPTGPSTPSISRTM